VAKKSSKSTGPGRVDCKVFADAHRAVVHKRITSKIINDSTAEELTRIEFDHDPALVWSPTRLRRALKTDDV